MNRRSPASLPSTKLKAQDLRSRAVEVGRGSFGVACRPADIRTRHSSSSAVDNLPWHGFGKIRGDERDIDDGKYGMDEGPTRTFDKHVAWRYDDMSGSKYLPTVASLLADKVIREDEIVGFSDENREHILRSASIR